MITAHLTKIKTGWRLTIVNGVNPIQENVLSQTDFIKKVEAKKFAKSIGAVAWNYV